MNNITHEKLQTNYFIELVKLLNIILVLYLLVSIIISLFDYPTKSNLEILIFLTPSIMYHCMPQVRNNCLYKLLASTMSQFAFIVLLINLALISYTDPDTIYYIVYLSLLYITVPFGLIGITLVILLSTDNPKKQDEEDTSYQKVVYYDPQIVLPRTYQHAMV